MFPIEKSDSKISAEANLNRLDWELDSLEGQPLFVSEKIPLPKWYHPDSYDYREHRRPAIAVVQRDGQTFYRPAWVFFAQRHITQTLAEVNNLQEAETIIVKYQQMFADSTSNDDYQRREEQMLRENSSRSL